MTKRFALPDTLPTPYFTIDAAAEAALAVRVAPHVTKGETRMSVEIWRGNTILCRLFAKSAEVRNDFDKASITEPEEKKLNSGHRGAAQNPPPHSTESEEHLGQPKTTRKRKSAAFDPVAMEAEAKRMVRDGTMPSLQQLEAALNRIRDEHAGKILEARERDQRGDSSMPAASKPGARGSTSLPALGSEE